jgi:hypothetical protein
LQQLPDPTSWRYQSIFRFATPLKASDFSRRTVSPTNVP